MRRSSWTSGHSLKSFISLCTIYQATFKKKVWNFHKSEENLRRSKPAGRQEEFPERLPELEVSNSVSPLPPPSSSSAAIVRLSGSGASSAVATHCLGMVQYSRRDLINYCVLFICSDPRDKIINTNIQSFLAVDCRRRNLSSTKSEDLHIFFDTYIFILFWRDKLQNSI